MMLPLFLLLIIIPTVSTAANNSLADCQRVASRFATTINNGPVADIRNTTGINVACPQLANVSCPGEIINGTCIWQQKLAITCINGSTVRIRVQSNGLPRRCTHVPNGTIIRERNIDFEVNFNPDVSIKTPNHNPSTSTALNNILCNTSNHMNVPSTSAFTRLPMSTPLNVLAGVAVDGVPILNVNNVNQVDPFYPTGNSTPEGADQCLSHPTEQGELHYHVASSCMINPPPGNVTECAPGIGCRNNVSSYSTGSFAQNRTLTIIGIAKDGHVIFGPYLSSGSEVSTGLDICNGMFFDAIGNYAYFATRTYPYVTGCFGPGNYPAFTPNCTTNGPRNYTMSAHALVLAGANNQAPKMISKMTHFIIALLSTFILLH